MSAAPTPGTAAGETRTAAPRRRRSRALTIGGPISLRAYFALAAAGFVLFVLAWILAWVFQLAPRLLLPAPWDVVNRLARLAGDGTLWSDVQASVWRIVVGFLIATALAIPIGVLIGTYRVAEAFIEPFVDFVRYMPVVGFVPLTIIWLGVDDSQKFAIVFIGTFFQAPSKEFGFDNKEIFSMLDAAEAETNLDKRTQMYQEANKKIMEFLPGIPYVHTEPALAFKAGVKGFVPSPVQNEDFSTVTISAG